MRMKKALLRGCVRRIVHKVSPLTLKAQCCCQNPCSICLKRICTSDSSSTIRGSGIFGHRAVKLFLTPKFDDTDNEAAARDELADPTVAPDADFSKKDFSAYAYDTGRLKISRELLTDAQRFSDFSSIEDLFVDALSERMRKIQGKKLTSGTGVDQPQGITVGAMLGHTAASQSGIVLDDIIEMSESIPEEYMEGEDLYWMMHQDTLKALKKLKDGENRPLWQMGNIQIGTPNNLYGHRVILNNYMPKIGAGNKPILFFNPRKFVIRHAGNMLMGRHSEATFPDIALQCWGRFDSGTIQTQAVRYLAMAA